MANRFCNVEITSNLDKGSLVGWWGQCVTTVVSREWRRGKEMGGRSEFRNNLWRGFAIKCNREMGGGGK